MKKTMNKSIFLAAMAVTMILSEGSTVFALMNTPAHIKSDFKIVGKYDEPICTDKDECEATGGTWSENLGGCEYPIGPRY
jgi:hypothetical protein